MSERNTPDASGFLSVYNVVCTDRRIIADGAFAHNDGSRVPLVWHHLRDDIGNVLGYVDLEHRSGRGIYAKAYFNDTAAGKTALTIVQHGDVRSFSVYANELEQSAATKQEAELGASFVVHKATVREASLVIAGANPEARIDYVAFEHQDGTVFTNEDEAIIYPGRESEFASLIQQDSDETLADIIGSYSEKQKEALYALVGLLLDDDSETEQALSDSETEHIEQGDNIMTNVFEKHVDTTKNKQLSPNLDFSNFMRTLGPSGSLKHAVAANPDAEAYIEHVIDETSEWGSRGHVVGSRPEVPYAPSGWVSALLGSVYRTPFSVIRNLVIDEVEGDSEDFRAYGYAIGATKVEGTIEAASRETYPQTIYKKESMERDNLLDITDFNYVMWMKDFLRRKLDSELARAILISDGRSPSNPSRILRNHVRPIWLDSPWYTTHLVLTPDEIIDRATMSSVPDNVVSYKDAANLFIDGCVMARYQYWNGTANPMLFIQPLLLANLLMSRDANGHRYYRSVDDIAAEIGVSGIYPVHSMTNASEDIELESGDITMRPWAVMVNPVDYVVGADPGGEPKFFDDFDLNINRQLYLLETRISGALIRHHGAVSIESMV